MKIRHAINEEINVYFHYIDCGFKKLIEKKWAIYGKFRLYIKQYYCIAQSLETIQKVKRWQNQIKEDWYVD